MAENTNFAKDVYNKLASNFDDFEISEQDFYNKLNSDPEYANKVYDVMSSNLEDFKEDKNVFIGNISSFKKKDQSDPSLVTGAPVSGEKPAVTSQSQLPLQSEEEPKDPLKIAKERAKQAADILNNKVRQINERGQQGIVNPRWANSIYNLYKQEYDDEISNIKDWYNGETAKPENVDPLALETAKKDFLADDAFVLKKAKEYSANRQEYEKSKAAYKWRSIFKNTLKDRGVSDEEANSQIEYTAKLGQLNIDPNTGQPLQTGYQASMDRIKQIKKAIDENIFDVDKKKEAIDAFTVDAYAALYQGLKDQDVVNSWAKQGNVFIGAGLDLLKQIDFDKAKNLEERINNPVAPASDKQLYLRELENIGLNAIAFESNRNMNRVTGEEELTGKKPAAGFIEGLSQWKQLAEKTKRSQQSRYPDVAASDIDRILLDVTEGFETPSLTKGIYNIAVGASDWLDRSMSAAWDYATKSRDGRIKTEMARDHAKYIAEDILNYGDIGSSLRNDAVIPEIVDLSVKQKIDDIKKDNKLSDKQKYEQTYQLVKDAYNNGGIEFYANPNKGNISLTAKNISHLLSTSGARSLGNIAPTVLSGGGLIMSGMVAGLDAAANKYDEQFREGKNDPLARALRTGVTVGGLAGIMDEATALANAFKGGRMTLASARPTVAGAVKEFGKMQVKEQAEELATEALDGNIVKNWKDVLISTALMTPLLTGPTAILSNRRDSQLYKQLWFEAGSNPESAKSGLKELFDNGDINESQYQEGLARANKLAQVVSIMPRVDRNGNPLTDLQKANYADNVMKKFDASKMSEDMPESVVNEMKEQAKKADQQNADILNGVQPEVKEEVKEEMKPEVKDRLKKEQGLTDADFVSEPFTPEEDTADRQALPQSEFASEADLKTTLETGEFAMLSGMNPEAMQISKAGNKKLNEKAKAWLEERGLKPVEIFGKYEGKTERSFFVPNMTKQQSIEFANAFGQDSVAHSTGLVYKDGSFFPRSGTVNVEPRFESGADNFSTINIGGKPVDFEVGYDFKEKVQPKPETDFDKKIQAAQKSLEKTGVNINVIEDPDEYDRLSDAVGVQKGTEGIFVADDGKIYINKAKLEKGIAEGLVVWHEAAHPVVNIVRNTSPELFNKVVSGLKSASKDSKTVANAFDWATKNYEGQETVDDEAVVEVIARVAEGVINLDNVPTGLKQSIIDLVNRMAKALGLGQVLSDTDVAAFKKLAGDVANALKTGQDISEIVGAENVKEYMNNIESPEIVAGGPLNVQGRVTNKPAINVYESKDVEPLPQKSLDEVYEQFGGKAVVINSDPTRVGELKLPSGKTIFMYGGPAYLSVKENVEGNVGFATTQQSKVNTWSKYVNEVFGNQPGVTLIGTQAPTSMLSNSYALRYVMDAISMLPKSVLKSSEFKKEFFGKDLIALKDAFGEDGYNAFVKKYKGADLTNPETIDKMISEMAYTVGDNNSPASFKARGAFVSNLLGGLAAKADVKTIEGDKGYVSKKPQKFIAKQLMDRLGINAEKVMYELGEKSLVDMYMNEGKWGFAVAGFETDPNINIQDVQGKGVTHPLFNAKFPGKNAFILDGAYDLNQMFTPVEMIGPSGAPYTKTASQMLAGSMYVKGQPLGEQGSFEYKQATPSGGRIQASKGGRNLVADAGLNKEMTSDDKGNYVFYHYSGSKIKSIDPKKFGKNLATGKDERPGVGISMYYTRPDVLETNVPSEFGYVVRVPESKVYPFNEDPLDLLPEAEKQFKKQYPGQAFDFNKQVGFVTKVAADRGYPMTVAEWNIKGRKVLRAQTTEAIKPEVYQEKVFQDGYQVTKTTPELDFKPNAKRKQQSVGNRKASDIIADNIQIGKPERKGSVQKFIETIGDENFSINWMDRLSREFLDNLSVFNKAADRVKGIRGLDQVLPANDPKVLVRLLNGYDAAFNEAVSGGMFDANYKRLESADGKPMNIDWLLEPLGKDISKEEYNKNVKDTLSYMVAKRTVELSKRFDRDDIISGIGDENVTDLKVAEEALKEFEENPNLDNIKEAASRYQQMADAALRYMVDKGRMPEAIYDKDGELIGGYKFIKENNLEYVALQRMNETPAGEPVEFTIKGKRGTIGGVSEPVKKIKGSEKRIQDPYVSLLDNLNKMMKEANRNEVMLSFRNLIAGEKDPETIKKLESIGQQVKEKGEGVVTIFVDGKPEYWKFQEDIYNSVKNLDSEMYNLPGWLTALPSLMRWTVTRFPTFAARNVVRDWQSRLILSNNNPWESIKRSITTKDKWSESARTGALNAGLYTQSKEFYYELLTDAANKVTKSGSFVVTPDKIKNLWKAYEQGLYKSETTGRVSEYEAAFNEAKKKGMDDYNAMLYAGSKARQLIDFAVAGNTMRVINQVIPFTNAAVQGLRAASKSAKENPAGFATRIFLFSLLPELAVYALSSADEEKKKQFEALPDWQRDMFYNVPIGDNKWLAVPKPFELSLFGSALSRGMSYSEGNKKAFDGYAGTVYKSLVPVEGTDIVGPYGKIIEMTANYDFFRGTEIIPRYESALDMSLRNTEDASRIGKVVGDVVKADPRMVDHFIKGQFTYFGKLGLELSNVGREEARDKFKLAEKSGFVKENSAYVSKPVQELRDFVDKWGIAAHPYMKYFKMVQDNYFAAKDPKEKEAIGIEMMNFAEDLLKMYKETNIEQLQQLKKEMRK
jgi:hypothetical protein